MLEEGDLISMKDLNRGRSEQQVYGSTHSPPLIVVVPHDTKQHVILVPRSPPRILPPLHQASVFQMHSDELPVRPGNQPLPIRCKAESPNRHESAHADLKRGSFANRSLPHSAQREETRRLTEESAAQRPDAQKNASAQQNGHQRLIGE